MQKICKNTQSFHSKKLGKIFQNNDRRQTDRADNPPLPPPPPSNLFPSKNVTEFYGPLFSLLPAPPPPPPTPPHAQKERFCKHMESARII